MARSRLCEYGASGLARLHAQPLLRRKVLLDRKPTWQKYPRVVQVRRKDCGISNLKIAYNINTCFIILLEN